MDSGIFQANSEFAGRISADSTDVAGNGTMEGEDDHGTLVAMVAAAANDGNGTVGIAYDATILSIRTDEPGSCASPDDCSFQDPDIAAAIDHATDHGAKVINISLGGGGASSVVREAVARAATAGVVIVVSAGNDGTARPDDFAQDLADAGNGNVLIVGSVDSSGEISSFSNRARGYTGSYLAARGERVTVYLDGPQWADDPDCPSPTFCLISGTSFSAPQVSGAVALLAQAFPTLTATQIVSLLLETAQDVGTEGADNTYGSGILDIYEAFQPQGTTSLAGTGGAIPLGDTALAGSPAMGDALQAASIATLVLDKYDRAFSTDLGPSMRGASVSRRLQGALDNPWQFVSAQSEKTAVAFRIADSGQGTGLRAANELRLGVRDAEAARVLAARIALKLSPETQIGLTYAEGQDGLVAQLQDQSRPAFLLAPTGSGDDGAFRSADFSLALRRQLGSWGMTLGAEKGEVVSGNLVELQGDGFAYRRRDGVHSVSMALDREYGALQTVFGLSLVNEDRTVLGGRLHDVFGGGGAQTLFLDANAGWRIADGWRLGGSLRNGWTLPETSSVITDASRIYSRSWSIDLERRGVLGARDALGLRIAQPLRVEGGGLQLNLPVAYSYVSESATFGTLPFPLTPEGREILGELAWHGPLFSGNASASLFYRRDPGHYADMPDDAGVAMRWNTRF